MMKFMKNRTVVGILCIALSLLICFGITPLFNQSISLKTEIVRVAKEIKTGDEITKDMVQTVEVGAYNLPENILKTKETVIGTFATADFAVGDYILNTKVSQTPAYENAISTILMAQSKQFRSPLKPLQAVFRANYSRVILFR